MPENWKTYKLSDAFDIIGGGTPKTTVDEYWNGIISWLSVVDFNNDQRTVYETEKSITELGLQKSSTKLLKKGQLIISARGTVGQLAQLGKDMTFNQSCYGLSGKESILMNDYGYYILKYSVGNIKSNAHGSVFDTITRNTFDNIEISIPPLQEQRAIASILSALDDKIELNLQMNKTLEEMAMALYKHWFVDFGPFQNGKFVESELGMIPERWEVRSIYSAANFVNGAAFKAKDFVENKDEGLPVIKIVEIKQGITSQTMFSNKELDSKYIIENNEILFPWSGNPHTSLGIHLWTNEKALLNQHTFVVRVEDVVNKCFVFNTLKHLLPTFIKLATHKQTTGLGHVTVANLKDLMISHPTTKVINDYNIEAYPIFDLIYSNQMENNSLKTLRDTLLPKLISGEIRVKDVEQLLAASL